MSYLELIDSRHVENLLDECKYDEARELIDDLIQHE
jgi:hypothetical protein